MLCIPFFTVKILMDVSGVAAILFVTGEDLTTDFRVHDIVAREGLSRMLLPDVCAEVVL
jgi:hypothetical protein